MSLFGTDKRFGIGPEGSVPDMNPDESKVQATDFMLLDQLDNPSDVVRAAEIIRGKSLLANLGVFLDHETPVNTKPVGAGRSAA